jgi:membrane fusion protein (multidrug efflux system)
MKKIIFLITILVALASCNKPQQAGQKQQPQTKSIPVIVEKIEERDLEKYIQFTGKLEGSTDITMVSETAGKVDKIYKNLGEWVKAGEAIGKVDDSEYKLGLQQAEANLNSAKASLENAEMQLQTSQKLLQNQNISKSEYNAVKSQYKMAQANLQSAKVGVIRAEKALNNARFTAPVSGYISDLNLELGQYVQMGNPIADIVNTKNFIIRTGIGEHNIQNIKEGQKVLLQHDNIPEQFYGRITGMGKKPAPGTSSYPIEIELKNPDNLYPGMVITGKILASTYKDVFYTSINNVIQEYDSYFVYVIDSNNIAHKRSVKLGPAVEVNVILKNGVNNDENLVIEGMANLEDGTKVEIRKKME